MPLTYMKRITVPCFTNGQPSKFSLYISDGCKDDKGPVDFQVGWCKNHNIAISEEAQNSIKNLHKLSLENSVSFEELTAFAFVLASKDKDSVSHIEQNIASAGDPKDDSDDDATEDDSDDNEIDDDDSEDDSEDESDDDDSEDDSEDESDDDE